MRDSKNLLLLLVSVGLVGTWVYHLYDKSRYSNNLAQVIVQDTVATQEARDSLERLFNERTHQLDTTRSLTDSLKGSLDSTMSKVLDLRRQISDILKNRNATNSDLKKARELISEYQQRIEEMKAQNSDLESERTRLNGVLSQLNDEMKGLQDNVSKMTQENKALSETINEASTFIASEMRLSIVTTKGSKETEVTSAKKADKLIFSFTLQNNIASTSDYDVYVVILQPDNKVLQTDVWGADHFETKTEGTKAYTLKVHFEYHKGERKNILYTLQPDNFLPGTYAMQVYQNGVSLGETTKVLN